LSDSTPRPHAQSPVQRLDERPLDGGGVREVLVLRAVPRSGPRHGCEIRVFSPRTDDNRAPPWPSLLLPESPELEMERTWERAERRRFEFDGETMRAQVGFPDGTSFYGAGSVAGRLLRTGRKVLLWNTDAWAYGEPSAALYSSHPWVLAVLADGRAVGLLADTFRRGALEIAPDGVELQFEAEPFDLYRIEGPDPLAVLRGLAALVGTMPMPPLWALGYHQCRWSYASADEVRAVARELRRRRIPCDALWLDIDYMDRFRVFTWDGERFPDPRGLLEELRAQGFRTVAILDPGVATAKGYAVFEEGARGDHFVRTGRGSSLEEAAPVRGRVWPGVCAFPDFTRPETRDWWAGRVAAFLADAPLDGLWNDMNEPALFRTPRGTLPDDARHAGWDASGPGDHARFHNLYGELMARATREGLLRARPEARPFVLTRAACATTARVAAAWTGDNQSRWEDLAWSIPMTVGLGLSGQPFAGPDAGGFAGDPSAELYARWYELAAFLPFFRGHAEKSSCRKEPWAFGPETEGFVRAAIERRMRLLPYLYTTFREAHETGHPVVRPVFCADPADPELRDVDDAFLLGGDLLVAPVVEAGVVRRDVLLPGAGGWYAFPGGARRRTERIAHADAPLGVVPLFARAGAIVPSRRASRRPSRCTSSSTPMGRPRAASTGTPGTDPRVRTTVGTSAGPSGSMGRRSR